MQIHRDINKLPKFRNAVVTIGSFDGVHIGHQQIIEQINHLAASVDGESVMITFYPHPRLALNRENSTLKLLNTLEEKAARLSVYKVDHLVVVPFSLEFASQSPEAYIMDFLVAKFSPKVIAIGYDHKFGKNRAGNIDYLRKFSDKYNFSIVEISKQEVQDIAVSSTKVRKAIQGGDIAKAARLLGHYPILSGKVVQGLQIGTRIGFPTANIVVDEPHKLIPPEGIYAVHVSWNNNNYKGMLCIGTRPTIGGDLAQTIEVNIFGFEQNIYGESIAVYFVDYLRANSKFDNLNDLQKQLDIDKENSLKILSNTTL